MKKVVLAVDDSKMVLNMIEQYLKDEYDVILATSGDQAFQVLQKRTVDIIVLDIIMPVMNGLLVLKKLRETKEYEDIPVLFFTGDAHRATVVESFQTGSQGYILKPTTKEKLIQRMEEVMRKQKERLEKKTEEEKQKQEMEKEKEQKRQEEERKRQEEEEKEKQKQETEEQTEETEEQEEHLPESTETPEEKSASEDISVKPVEDQEDMFYDPFDDLGDVLENFVKADEDTE